MILLHDYGLHRSRCVRPQQDNSITLRRVTVTWVWMEVVDSLQRSEKIANKTCSSNVWYLFHTTIASVNRSRFTHRSESEQTTPEYITIRIDKPGPWFYQRNTRKTSSRLRRLKLGFTHSVFADISDVACAENPFLNIGEQPILSLTRCYLNSID